ncbi:MAG TPA: PspC domain-containing protein [Ilumatobacteraceae bacterium]|nr:PspC domain-containing protein [Ilumatobacteraceae bacterium]
MTESPPGTPLDDAPGSPPPPPPPAGGGASGAWHRTPISRIPKEDDEGLHIAGVVSGISRAYGFDVRTTRIALVIAAIVLPGLALVYLALWILLPDRPTEAQSLGAIVRDRRRLPVLIAIALVLVLGGIGSFGAWFVFRDAPWGLAVVALGVLLWVSTSTDRRPRAVATSTAVAWAPPTARATATSAMPFSTTTIAPHDDASPTSEFAVTQPPTRAIPTPPAKPRRRRRPIGAIGFLAAFAFAALAAFLEAVTSWDVTALWVIVTALAIFAIGLIVSLAVNRRWWLIAPILPVLWLITVLSIVQPNFDGGTGHRDLTPTTIEDAEDHQQLSAGNIEIDLRSLPELGDDPVEVSAEVGAGRISITVPSDATLELHTHLGMGVVQLDGRDISEGFRQDDNRTVNPIDEGGDGGTIVLDLDVGFGQIEVVRSN